MQFREPVPFASMPKFHCSMPFYLKIFCIVIAKAPFRESFQVTMMGAISPLLMLNFMLVCIYIHPVFLSRHEHKHFLLHAFYIVACSGLSLQAVLLMMTYEVSAAPLTALLCSVHLAHATAESLNNGLDIMKIRNLVPQQSLTCALLYCSMLFVIVLSWFTMPRVNLDFDAVVYAMFIPETVGVCVRVAAGLLFW